MKLIVRKEDDALYLRLEESEIVESEEVSDGIILDYNQEGKVVGIEVLRVSQRNPDALREALLENA